MSDSEIRLLAAGASTEDIDQVLRPVDRSYRYAYQGQFAESDKGTGWSHFESWEYDPVIGRWLVPDPAGQHWSPYLAMGNNPVVSVDPNGELAGTIIGALIGAGVAAWNHENIWRGAASGAVAGATFDLIVGSAIATGGASLPFIIGAGAVSGAAGAMTEQVWDATIGGRGGAAFSAQKTLTGAAWGAAAPLVGKLIGAAASKVASMLLTPKGTATIQPLVTPVEAEAMIAAEASAVRNSKGVPYPRVVVEGYGEVPFPEGPFTPNKFIDIKKRVYSKIKS